MNAGKSLAPKSSEPQKQPQLQVGSAAYEKQPGMIGSVLFKLLSRLYFLQDLLGRVVAGTTPILVHNLGKYLALKKAFYLTFLEQVDGDYLEFGVFTGSSMSCAMQCAATAVVSEPGKTGFFGFDSFAGFGDLSDEDKHPFFTNLNFKTSYSDVNRRLQKKARKNQTVRLIEGFFSDTCDGHSPESYGIGRARVILIDCDTLSGALSCLKFCSSVIQEGTVLILDDFFSYKGHQEKGVFGAFRQWNAVDGHLKFRQVASYGMGGVILIAHA